MSRRGRSRSPFSLFSFQDIITCVSGIIILVTLVLALELSQRKQGTPHQQTADVTSQLRAAIAEAKAEQARLETLVSERARGAQEVLGASPATLEHDIESMKQQISSLQSEIAALERQEQRSAIQENKLQANRFDRDKDVKKIADQQSKAAALEAELRTIRAEGQVFYNARTADGKQVWLVQIDGPRVLVGRAGTSDPPLVLESRSGLFSRSSFDEWLDTRSTSADFLFLLVRPGGLDEFEAIKKSLTRLRFGFGYDLLGKDQSAVKDVQQEAGS